MKVFKRKLFKNNNIMLFLGVIFLGITLTLWLLWNLPLQDYINIEPVKPMAKIFPKFLRNCQNTW